MNVTINDIARATGLSTATISKYINHKKIRGENRILREKAIQELGYTPNRNAQLLRAKNTHTIGILISDLGNYFWGELVNSIIKHFTDHGYTSDSRLSWTALLTLQTAALFWRKYLTIYIVQHFLQKYKRIQGQFVTSRKIPTVFFPQTIHFRRKTTQKQPAPPSAGCTIVQFSLANSTFTKKQVPCRSSRNKRGYFFKNLDSCFPCPAGKAKSACSSLRRCPSTEPPTHSCFVSSLSRKYISMICAIGRCTSSASSPTAVRSSRFSLLRPANSGIALVGIVLLFFSGASKKAV